MTMDPAENRIHSGTAERETSPAAVQSETRTVTAAQHRLSWPDWIRGAAMIGVISVHVSGVSGFPDNPLLLWLNSFAMALFFFISGNLMRNSRDCAAAVYARRKAAAVLWPYLTFSACAVLFDIAVLKLQGGSITRDLVRLWLRCVFTLVGRGTLWFLPVFYFACVLVWAVRMRRVPSVLLFLAGLGFMAFMNEIFGITVAVLTGGGDGIGSDLYLVAVRSFAAAAVILEGFWIGPLLDRLAVSKHGTPAALLSFLVSLVIPVFYRMDFRTARFGRYLGRGDLRRRTSSDLRPGIPRAASGRPGVGPDDRVLPVRPHQPLFQVSAPNQVKRLRENLPKPLLFFMFCL